MRDHLDAEGLRLGRHQARDVAEADEPENGAFDAADRHHRRHFPTAALHQFVGQRHFADQRQQQRHGMVRHLANAIVRHVIDGDAFFLRGRQIDVVDAETETADRFAARELGQNIARQLGVGHQHRIGILGHGNDVVGVDALRHAVGWIETRQRGLCRIERGENTIGNRDHRAGHCKLQSENGTELVENYDSGVDASTMTPRREGAFSMAYPD